MLQETKIHAPDRVRGSARDVIDQITKGSDYQAVTNAVNAALRAQYENARLDQLQKKVQFDLTFDEMLALVTPSRRKKMEDKMRAGTFAPFMKSIYGYCLSWREPRCLPNWHHERANSRVHQSSRFQHGLPYRSR